MAKFTVEIPTEEFLGYNDLSEELYEVLENRFNSITITSIESTSDEQNIKDELQKVFDSINNIDDILNGKLNTCKHGSDDFKHYQRMSNELLKILNATIYLNTRSEIVTD